MPHADHDDDEVAVAEVVEDGAPTTADVTGGGELVRVDAGPLMQTAAPLDAIAHAFTDHVALVEKVVAREDWQVIQGKQFLKKGGLRKLATAYGVSAEIIDRDLTVDPATGRVTRAEFVVRATAPNGRTMDGYGSCDLTDKCDRKCAAKENHNPADHFSHPNHDIPATAETRAKNRAFSDLFAMGQVTAEEVGNPEQWEVLGWPSEAGFRGLMDPLHAFLKDSTDLVRAEWKQWRTDNGVQWPVDYAHARDVRQWMQEAGVGQDGDDEYQIEGAGGGPTGPDAPARNDAASAAPERAEQAAPPPESPAPDAAAPPPSRAGRRREGVADPAPAAPSPPSRGAGDDLAPTPKMLQKLAIGCKKLADATGVDPDVYRHALMSAVTGDRVRSASKARRREVGDAIETLAKLESGELVLDIDPERVPVLATT